MERVAERVRSHRMPPSDLSRECRFDDLTPTGPHYKDRRLLTVADAVALVLDLAVAG
jgi:hypothetical protein